MCALADSVVLQLLYDMIFIAIFKIKHELYIALGSALTPSSEKCWVSPCVSCRISQSITGNLNARDIPQYV